MLIGATSVDYVAGALDRAHRERERAGGCCSRRRSATNIGILAYFKYAGFFLGSLNGIGSGVGLADRRCPSLHILLPIGISFYTFNSMSYTIDIFRRRDRADPATSSSTRPSSRSSRT